MTKTIYKLDWVAKCGVYCGNCKRLQAGKCGGCLENEKAGWCKIRSCCLENGLDTCADCSVSNPRECSKYQNLIASAFAFIFRSDRPASIDYIRKHGRRAFISLMTEQKQMVIRKGQSFK